MRRRFFSPAVARTAANVATAGFLLASVLQLLVALGVVPITMAWGGMRTVLTTPVRIASVVAAAILGLSALIVRRRAGLLGDGCPSQRTGVLTWGITAYMALNTLGNVASRSRGETVLFGPLSLVLTLACLVVAASRQGDVGVRRSDVLSGGRKPARAG